MFETIWGFMCMHWIWIPRLVIGGFIYMSVGYLLLLAKLKVARSHISYDDHTYMYSMIPGFWTFVFFPDACARRFSAGNKRLRFEEIPPVAKYLNYPKDKEQKDYPYWVVFFWPVMPAWLILYILGSGFALLFISLLTLPFYLIINLGPLIFNFFTWPIRKFLVKPTKPSAGQL